MGKEFGRVLRKMRKERGLSQQALASAVNVERSLVSKWENGSSLPDAIMLGRIADALKTSSDYILTHTFKGDRAVNVVIVDDNRVVLRDSVSILKQALPGANIASFTRASQVLAYAAVNTIDFAYLDIELGASSGLKLCKELLNINPDTAVFFLTAYSDYSFPAWETGAQGFMLKPLSVECVQKQLELLKIRGGVFLAGISLAS